MAAPLPRRDPRVVRGADVRAADELGPGPLLRAAQGLALGAAAGLVAALLTPRPDRARRTLAADVTGTGPTSARQP
jgi:hypothetical protein